MHQLYLSANHLSRRNIPAYFDALTKYGVNHIIAYSSSISYMAQVGYELGLSTPGVKVVLTNAEPLLPWQREIIAKGLKCTVRGNLRHDGDRRA